MKKTRAFPLGISLFLIFSMMIACTSASKDDDEEEETPLSWDGAWYKAWTSDYQYDSTSTHLCRYILAEYSGSTFALSFYGDNTTLVFGLKGSFTKTGYTSGTVTYNASQMWDSSTKKWIAYSQSMTQNFSALSAASAAVSDWAGVNQTYSKVTFSRPAALAAFWGGNYDFGPGMENTSMHLAADGVYKFYEDGTNTQTGTWWNGSVQGGGSFLRSPILSGTDPDFYHDFLTPYTLSGSVMTLDQGDSNPAYVVTKAAELTGTVDTLAGTGTQGHLDDPTNGLAAIFNHPQSVAAVGDSLYVVDTIGQYIRKVSISTSAVSTIAGRGETGAATPSESVGTNAYFSSPAQIAADGTYLYVADTSNYAIRRITLSGSYPVETYTNLINLPDGQPTGIAVSGNYLYVSDYYSGTIYRLDKTNLSSSVDEFYPTGMSTSIRFLASDGTFLYLATGENHGVVRISLQDATMETLVSGSGEHVDGYGAGTTGTPAANTDYPWGIVVDSNYLYYAESDPIENDANTIRRMHLGTRYVDTLAGSYGASGAQDETGTAATFYNPAGLCLANGVLYVADKWNHKIRAIR